MFSQVSLHERQDYREFFVTDIQTEDFETIDKKPDRNMQTPIHEIIAPNDPEFWNNFNIILLEKPLKN